MGGGCCFFCRASFHIYSPSLPLFLPPDFDVTFDNNVLRVACERKEEKEEEDARWHISERRWGSSSRSVRLPRTAHGENIKAEYDAGVLKVTREGGERGEGGQGGGEEGRCVATLFV